MPRIRDLGINAMPAAEPCGSPSAACLGGNCNDASQASCDQTQSPDKDKEKKHRDNDKNDKYEKRRAGAFNAAAIAQLKQQLQQQLGNRAY